MTDAADEVETAVKKLRWGRDALAGGRLRLLVALRVAVIVATGGEPAR
jgi:predicted negative regulator of RcsB-dependent stress response